MAGHYGVSIAAMRAPVVTGLYRNSLSFKTSTGINSGTGSAAGKGKTVVSAKGQEVSGPEQSNTVRIGSGVIYAGKVEQKHGTLAVSFDTVVSRLDDLAAKAMA